MSQVIVINDLSQLGTQLKAALVQAGINPSQFGDLESQIKTAFEAAGVVQPEAVAVPETVEPEGPIFGEILNVDEDEIEFSVSYNVKNAANIELTFNESGSLDVVMVSKDGDENSDEIDCDELVGVDATAYVENDVLYVSLPKLRFPESGDSVSVINFNPDADVAVEEDEDDFAGEADEQGEWCEVCNEYHDVN